MAYAPYVYMGTFSRTMEDALNQVKTHLAATGTGSGTYFVHTHVIEGNGFYQAAVIYA